MSRKTPRLVKVFAETRRVARDLRALTLNNSALADRHRELFLPGIRSFSLGAVVIDSRCMSIRVCIVTTSPLTHCFGGQYGEESEEGEEGQEGEEEEEVVSLPDNDAIDSDVDAASQRPARPKPKQRKAATVATSALVDDGGRRRNRDHPLRIRFCVDRLNRSGFLRSRHPLQSGRVSKDCNTGHLSFSPMPSVDFVNRLGGCGRKSADGIARFPAPSARVFLFRARGARITRRAPSSSATLSAGLS